ncbi:cilia- and flagella-associated protein 90-like [Montipora foliosa]|uniref:cilia- and flagella-associated protein 90-like n=1 Tax=Montipora foliosa TaxID=591990 RepID=UPI0035F1D85D
MEETEELQLQGIKGRRMSNYGVKTYTPEQIKEQWRESMRREIRFRRGHLITSGHNEALSNVWKTKFSRHLSVNEAGNQNYFNTKKQHEKVSNYDRTFHIKTGFSSKLHRDDREHTRGLNVNAEEQTKAVPVLSSSLYGHRTPLERTSRGHVRVATVKRDFYRQSGTNIPLF